MKKDVAAQRIKNLPEHFFSSLVAKVQKKALTGADIIDLGRGNPDQPTPPHIVEVLCKAARDPSTHGYSPFSGLKELREAICVFYEREFGVKLDPDREVAILFGSKAGLVEISQCVLDPGDICLVPNPGYPDYWSGIALAGAKRYDMPVIEENGFLPDYENIPREIVSKAKLMLINYPSNPTTAQADLDFFKATVKFAKNNGIIVAHDFAYGSIVFDGKKAPSFLQAEGAKDVGVEFYSLSKTYNMAGWRVGFALGNESVISAINTLQNHYFASLFPAVQKAAAAALTGPQECVKELVDIYQMRRDIFVEGLRQIGLEVCKPAGTFFVWGKVPKGFSSVEFFELLLERANVVVAPGIGFGKYGEGYFRAGLLDGSERLKEAVYRIGKALE
ncbi:MAG: L-glutamine---4-(methylsulfanyl)-2-oxobutanoate aminotransferase [Thermosediminibacterales bacterium]|nr:L-glutamine---4-(methylsulfanyl)-2-oxobutanoate aminotransferase [Thermosediminibacterales bacterium]